MTNLSKTIISVSACAFIIISIALFIIMPKYELSFNENRYLQKAPEFSFEALFQGELTENIELYINDHFPYRDEIVGIKSACEKLIGKKIQNGIYLGKNEYLIKEYSQYDEKMMDNHCARLNEFAQSTSADVYMILAPNSNLIYSENKPKFASDYSQAEDIGAFYSKLDNINTIDIIPSLLEQKSNYQLYFRLDHHWSCYGAYFAYNEFCRASGIAPYTLDEFDIVRIADEFNGTYYSKSTYYGYTSDTIDMLMPKSETDILYENLTDGSTSDSLYFDEHLETQYKYAYFLNDNQPLIKITNNAVTNSKSIAVVKDSYANILVPYLVNHYSTVYVVDMRYNNESLSKFVRENKIDDVLFLYNIQTIQNDLGILKIK